MRSARLGLIAVVALSLVLGAASVWLLADQPSRGVVSPDANVTTRTPQTASLDSARPELGVEQKLLAPWMNEFQAKYSTAATRPDASERQSGQVATAVR